MNLNAFMEEHSSPEEEPSNTRVRIPVEELEARLKFYEEHTPGFEATQDHLDALIAIFNRHENVFVTGGAGTGKTTFIRSVVMPELDYRNLHWSVTATTGIAGSHLEGKTIHSFFGIGLGPDWKDFYPREMSDHMECRPGSPTACPQDMSGRELEAWYGYHFDKWLNGGNVKAHVREGVKNRLKGHEVLLIDEISMCAGDAMLGYLDFMLRHLRDNEKPFGGMQLIFIGDYAQLPPVEERDDFSRPDWAFMSLAWDRAKVQAVELSKVFRQGDQDFIRFLNNVRVGKVTPDDRHYVRRFVRNDMDPKETRYYTFLVPTNKQAKRINLSALENYPGPTQPVTAEFQIVPELQKMSRWEADNTAKVEKRLARNMRLVEKTTFLRIGLPVMFTVNDPGGQFVNGTRGFVREINLFPRDAADPSDRDNIVVGVPGKNLDDPERMVTLRRWPYSRERDQDPFDMIPVPEHYHKVEGAQLLPDEIAKYPVVRQFPLIPATAITIHKSQGMSLDRAILALSRSFAAGQVYVGLSRLTSPEGLIMAEEDFAAKVDPNVMEYYRSIRENAKRQDRTAAVFRENSRRLFRE